MKQLYLCVQHKATQFFLKFELLEKKLIDETKWNEMIDVTSTVSIFSNLLSQFFTTLKTTVELSSLK